jgi:cyclophilin family peptidyl-prolyl cis-trans isomerase
LSCSDPDNDEVAVIETSYGRIAIELLAADAPKHVANFKELARAGSYDGTKFHRLVKGGGRDIAIQGGDPNTINGDPSTWGQGNPNQKTVPHEFSTTLKHVRGIVSAARRGNDVDSATSQFFICTAGQPGWDGQYSIFGRVIEGMNVVDTIVRAPVWPNTERPMDPVTVTRVYLVKRTELK